MRLQRTLLSLSIVLLLTACGGGGSSEEKPNLPPSTPNPSLPNPTIPTIPDAPGQQESILNTVNIEDVASELTAESFGQSSWVPRAMFVSNNILYIGDSYPTVQILRYDLINKRVLPKIILKNSNPNGRAIVWKDLTDIYLDGQRLYVANGVDQRVDVFHLQGNTAEFIMSLGTGTSNANIETLGLNYPMAVLANQDYVFVADQNNQISVWAQNSIQNSNDLTAQKQARLSLPNCMRGCMARMELLNGQLYVATNTGHSYVYDLADIQAAANGADRTRQLIQASKVQENAATAFHFSATDQLMYSAQPSGRIQMFKQPDMQNATQVLPSVQFDAVSQYRLAGQAARNMNKALDISTHDDMILSLFDQKIVLLPIRRLQHKQQSTLVTPVRLLESKAIQSSRVLQDGESWETLTNQDLRHVFMDKILSAKFDRNVIRLQSYSAVPVRDLQIKAKLRKTDQWVVLAELDQLTPFSNRTLEFNLNSNTRFNFVDGSGSVRLDGIERFVEMPANLFEDIRIDSTTDTHVQKLNSIKAKWKIFFGTYDQPGKWCRITPVYAREWVIMMTNMAYMLSTPEFKTLWFNHKDVMGHDFFGNAGKVDGQNGYFKAEDYQRVYNEILNRNRINLGITNMGGGLGGGEVLGVDTWLFYGHYRLSGFRIIAHEFGHGWGGHNSAWAMSGHGFEAMVDWLNFYFQRQPGSLPYMDPNVNAFHLTPDTELCQSVNQNMLKGVASSAPWNKVDEYFKYHPVQTD